MSVRTDLAFQVDSNITDGSRLLDAYLHDLDIELTRDDVTVSGAQVCE